MAIFKGIKPSSISSYEIETYKSFTLDSSSVGINSIQYRSGSRTPDGLNFTVSGSYWNSLQMNFYLSGSYRNTQEKKYGFSKYNIRI